MLREALLRSGIRCCLLSMFELLLGAVSMAASATYKQPLGRVMPTVFVAGPAKSGSTFLWDCVQQTFHPEQVCRGPVASWADGPCGSRAFVLPAVGSEDSQPACLRFGKEGRFWTHWGRSTPGSRQYTWRRYGGPALPMQAWEQGGTSCPRRGTAVYLCGVASPLGRAAGRVAARGVTVARHGSPAVSVNTCRFYRAGRTLRAAGRLVRHRPHGCLPGPDVPDELRLPQQVDAREGRARRR